MKTRSSHHGITVLSLHALLCEPCLPHLWAFLPCSGQLPCRLLAGGIAGQPVFTAHPRSCGKPLLLLCRWHSLLRNCGRWHRRGRPLVSVVPVHLGTAVVGVPSSRSLSPRPVSFLRRRPSSGFPAVHRGCVVGSCLGCFLPLRSPDADVDEYCTVLSVLSLATLAILLRSHGPATNGTGLKEVGSNLELTIAAVPTGACPRRPHLGGLRAQHRESQPPPLIGPGSRCRSPDVVPFCHGFRLWDFGLLDYGILTTPFPVNMECDVYIRIDLYINVVFSGGTAMFTCIRER